MGGAAQALLITTGMFAAMTGLAMFAKPGAALRYGVPLGGELEYTDANTLAHALSGRTVVRE